MSRLNGLPLVLPSHQFHLDCKAESTAFFCFKTCLEDLENADIWGIYCHILLLFRGKVWYNYYVLIISQLLFNLELCLHSESIHRYLYAFILLIKKWNIWKTFSDIYLTSEPFKKKRNPPLIIKLCWLNISLKYSFMYFFWVLFQGSYLCKIILWRTELVFSCLSNPLIVDIFELRKRFELVSLTWTFGKAFS